jgi:AraC-like DNA-binding protein
MQIAQEAAQGAAGSKLMVDALTPQLAVHTLRRHAHVRFRECGGDGDLTFRQEHAVRDYIQHHLGRPITLDDLAGEVGMSRLHFARRFRSTTGTTPHDFPLQQRVKRARTMLERTSTSLSEIARECGFADQSHLTREFKKRAGMTPGAYARSGDDRPGVGTVMSAGAGRRRQARPPGRGPGHRRHARRLAGPAPGSAQVRRSEAGHRPAGRLAAACPPARRGL